MKISCVIPVGPTNVTHLREAWESQAGLFEDTILVAHAAQEFNPDIQRAVLEGARLVVDYGDSMADRFNLGVAYAHHEWVTLLCSDDYLFAHSVVQMRGMMEQSIINPPPDVVFAQVHEFDDADLEHHQVWPWHHSVNMGVINRINCVPIGAWFKKWYWHQVGGFKHVDFCDWVFWQDIYGAGGRFQMLGEFVFYAHRNWLGSTGTGP